MHLAVSLQTLLIFQDFTCHSKPMICRYATAERFATHKALWPSSEEPWPAVHRKSAVLGGTEHQEHVILNGIYNLRKILLVAGPKLKFHAASVVALTGAQYGADLDGKPVASWKSFTVPAGSILTVGKVSLSVARHCCRWLCMWAHVAAMVKSLPDDKLVCKLLEQLRAHG